MSDRVPRPILTESSTTRLRRGRHGYLLFNRFDDTIGRAVDLYGEWAEAECLLLAGYLTPGDVALDIGANIGTHTLSFAELIGNSGRVYAFEPQHEMFQIMAANVALNGFRNVRAVCAAVGRRLGSLTYDVPDYGKPANFGALSLCTSRTSTAATETVPVVTVDSLNLNSVSLVKIDVEGMELDVLRGCEETVARCCPVVYAENTSASRSVAVVSWLKERGYRIFWHIAIAYNADNYAGESENIFGSATETNILCLPADDLRVPLGLRELADPSEFPAYI